MSAPELNIDSFKEFLKERVEDTQKKLDKPDDDWIPCAFIAGEKGHGIMPLHEFLSSDEMKDILAQKILPMAVEKADATIVGMILSSWSTRKEKDDNTPFVPPSEDINNPTRKEMVWVSVFTEKEVRFACAEILRDAVNPPTLGPWEEFSEGVDSRFGEPIQRAMRNNKKPSMTDVLFKAMLK